MVDIDMSDQREPSIYVVFWQWRNKGPHSTHFLPPSVTRAHPSFGPFYLHTQKEPGLLSTAQWVIISSSLSKLDVFCLLPESVTTHKNTFHQSNQSNCDTKPNKTLYSISFSQYKDIKRKCRSDWEDGNKDLYQWVHNFKTFFTICILVLIPSQKLSPFLKSQGTTR